MEKTPIKKNSITRNAIKNSFIFFLTLVQLIKIHKKINKVVRRMKNNEIPSTPKVKFKFRKGIHNNLVTNWNEPIDLLKKTHKNNDITYKIQDTFKAVDFSNEWLEEGTNNKKKVPSKGNTRRNASKLVKFNKKKSSINILQDLNLCLSA